MQLSIITAITLNNAIGFQNKLIHHDAIDLENFKELTLGSVVIMGRKTQESLPKGYLPDRINIAISSIPTTDTDDILWETSLEDAVVLAETFNLPIFIIGGASLYKEALDNDIVDTIYLTKFHIIPAQADTFFPPIYYDEWRTTHIHKYQTLYNNIPIYASICKLDKY